MSKDLKLSPKHGVNPSVEICYICGKDAGVILFGLLKGDVEAPRKACINKVPCAECKEWMTKGVICISVNPTLSQDKDDPWRSGGWIVLKDEAVERMFGHNKSVLSDVLKHRVMFLEDDAWDELGLPARSPNDA